MDLPDGPPVPWPTFNNLMSQKRLSLNDDKNNNGQFFGAIDSQPANIHGEVPGQVYQHFRNGMKMRAAAQHGASGQANANQVGPSLAQPNQGGPIMTQQSQNFQQPSMGLDCQPMFYQAYPPRMSTPQSMTMPLATQHEAFGQANTNQAGLSMAQPNQGGAVMTQQSHNSQQFPIGMDGQPMCYPDDPLRVPTPESTTMSLGGQQGDFPHHNSNLGGAGMAQGNGFDGNMAAPGDTVVGLTASGPFVGGSGGGPTVGGDTQLPSSSRTVNPEIPIDPSLRSSPTSQGPGSQPNGQDGSGTA